MGRHLPKYQGKEKTSGSKETVHQKQKKERGKEGSKEAIHESTLKNQGFKSAVRIQPWNGGKNSKSLAKVSG